MDYFAGDVPSASAKNSNSSRCGGTQPNSFREIRKDGGLQNWSSSGPEWLVSFSPRARNQPLTFNIARECDSEAVIWFLALKKWEGPHISRKGFWDCTFHFNVPSFCTLGDLCNRGFPPKVELT